MRVRSALLGVSVALNAAFTAAFLARPAATSAYLRTIFSHAPSTASPSAPAKIAARAPVADAAAINWASLDLTDTAGLVARLRAAGFPPSLVRTIVSGVVNEQFAAREVDLMRARMPADYWKNARPDAARDLQINAAMRDLNREKQKLLRDALGADFFAESDNPWLALNRERQFGSLPQAKIDQLHKIENDYNELTQKVHEDSMGFMLPEDRAKLALLEKEKKADIERLFTPDELTEYELRNSRAANLVRGRAGRFDLTEQEFRAVYAVAKEYSDAHPPLDRPQPGVAENRQQNLDAAFRNVLGEDRYAEMKRVNDAAANEGNQEMLLRLATRLNLPASTPADVIAVQKDIEQRATSVRSNTTLTLGERSEQLASLANEATAKLVPVLGPRGLDAYKQSGGGLWINNLTAPAGGRGRGGPLPNN